MSKGTPHRLRVGGLRGYPSSSRLKEAMIMRSKATAVRIKLASLAPLGYQHRQVGGGTGHVSRAAPARLYAVQEAGPKGLGDKAAQAGMATRTNPRETPDPRLNIMQNTRRKRKPTELLKR